MPDAPGRVAAEPGWTVAEPGRTVAEPGRTVAEPGRRAAGLAEPQTAPAGRWIGVPVRRTEDPYLLTGRGSFVGDHEPPGTLHLALVRSYLASAAIEAVDAGAALSH